jgi:hypothetical protein
LKKELQKYEDEKVDPEGELTCDQNEITKLRRENMLLKEKLSQSLEEKEKIIKVQIEEAEVINELIEKQLKEKGSTL